MRFYWQLALLLGVVSSMTAVESTPPGEALALGTLPPLPDAHGFAGMFAGVSGGALLCAGGANFPEKPLAQGGRKVWHDRVFALATPSGEWREVGRLPQRNGYGVSATWGDAVVLVGGGDERENFRNATLLRWDGARLAFEPLPPLPVTMANGCGTVVGDTLYVAGGQETPAATTALRRCFSLDLAAAARVWQEIPWPDAAGRILAVAGADNGGFFIFSGADLMPNSSGAPERRYLTDAWCYRPVNGWKRLADLPHAVAAAPSPVMSAGRNRFVIVGGVWPEYLSRLPKDGSHPGFTPELLAYNMATDTWSELPSSGYPAAVPPRVTAPLAAWKKLFAIPSGEMAPGIRTPTVLTFQFTP